MRRRVIGIASIAIPLMVVALLALTKPTLFPNPSPTSNNQRQAGAASLDSTGTATLLPSEATSLAQNQVVLSGNGFTTGREVKHDRSPRMRDIPIRAETPPATPREMGDEGDEVDSLPGEIQPQIVDPVRQANLASPSTLALALTPPVSFDGISNLDSVYPPDTTGDVGPNDYVQWVNLHFEVFDKSGKSLLGPLPGNALWSGFGGSCETGNAGDIQVLYDSLADRWVMAQFTSSSPYGECIAVSVTGDPTGAYYRYFFQFSSAIFYDYTKLGLWPDGYYLSANRFVPPTGPYLGPSAIALDRNAMLNGQVAAYLEYQLSPIYGTLLPANLDGSTVPPVGEPAFFAEIGNTALHLWKFSVNWTTPAASILSGPVSLASAAYNLLCPVTRSCIPQPITPVGLDGLGDRLMQRLNYRNFGSYEALVVTHNVNAASSGTTAGLRWYEIRNPNGAAAIYQQGTFAPDSNNRWMGSIAMDQAGDIALGYSIASSSLYPGIRFTGRLATDPKGFMTLGETTIMDGSGYQNGAGSRWGDYSDLVLDPVDNCTFWYTTEYVAVSGTASWRTRITAFKLPSCGGPPPKHVYLPLINK